MNSENHRRFSLNLNRFSGKPLRCVFWLSTICFHPLKREDQEYKRTNHYIKSKKHYKNSNHRKPSQTLPSKKGENNF